MKLVIGFIGEIGSGKGTAWPILKDLINDKPGRQIITTEHINFSTVLGETLRLWHISLTRENYQKLSPTMKRAYGDDALSNAIKHRIEQSSAAIVVVDGVRWWSDVKMIRSFERNLLVYITADYRLRYLRAKERGEKAGEKDMNFEGFVAREQEETELDIPVIGQTADVKIINNGSLEDFHKNIVTLYRTRIQPVIS